MPAFTELARRLLREGVVRLREPPDLPAGERERVLALLAEAYHDHRLDVAGAAPLPFAPGCALRALEGVAWSCWFLLHRGESAAEVERRLAPLPAPASASEHLSADLVLRFLAVVHRRARAADPRDPLTRWAEETLRRWPLSGVLADIDEPPREEVVLGGHPGLLLLYAERLALRPRPAWLPAGPGRMYAELVFGERGGPTPFPRSTT
jgi:hypothetical protein